MEKSRLSELNPEVYHISDSSLLRKSSCNYLRSAVSCVGSIALIVAEGIRIYSYSYTSGNIVDTFNVIRLPVGDLIRDIAWSPASEGKKTDATETLAICFENRLELWFKSSIAKVFSLQHTFTFGKKVLGILQVLWDKIFPSDLLISTSSAVFRVRLTTVSEGDNFQALPSLSCRHPGGIGLCGCALIAGNQYREAVSVTGLINVEKEHKITNQHHGRLCVAIEQCRAPSGLSERDLQEFLGVKYNSSCIETSGELCVLSFEPEASLSTTRASTVSSLLKPSVDIDCNFSACPSVSRPQRPVISVISSSESFPATKTESDCFGKVSVSEKAVIDSKPKGAFPHSTFKSSISETLAVCDHSTDYVPIGHTQSPFDVLTSLSSSVHSNPDKLSLNSKKRDHDKQSLNFMSTGLICALIRRNKSESSGSKEIVWLGSTLSLVDANSSVLRPDVMALWRIDELSSKSQTGSYLLAVSSTICDKIVVYDISHKEGEKLRYDKICDLTLPDEGRCRGLCFMPFEARDGVVLLVLCAKSKANSLATHSTSASYSTSVLSYKFRNGTYNLKESQAAMRKSDGMLEKVSPCTDTMTMLSSLKDILENRLGNLEVALLRQEQKIDRLQECVENLMSHRS